MSTRVLAGLYDGTAHAACLVDSCSGVAFGPLFSDADEAHAFLAWMAKDACDPRASEDLSADLLTFREERRCKANGCDMVGTVQVDGLKFCRHHSRAAKRWRDKREEPASYEAGLEASLAVEHGAHR